MTFLSLQLTFPWHCNRPGLSLPLPLGLQAPATRSALLVPSHELVRSSTRPQTAVRRFALCVWKVLPAVHPLHTTELLAAFPDPYLTPRTVLSALFPLPPTPLRASLNSFCSSNWAVNSRSRAPFLLHPFSNSHSSSNTHAPHI